MTTAVTKESLVARIAELESGARSLKEDYTLAAYKMLLAVMEAEPVADVVPWSHPNEERTCDIRWRRHDIAPGPLYRYAQPVLEIEGEPVFTLEVARADYKGQKLGNHFGFITLDAARELKEGNYQLYTAQPAPVVPEDCPSELISFCEQVIDSRITANAKADELWNACRVAMLNQK